MIKSNQERTIYSFSLAILISTMSCLSGPEEQNTRTWLFGLDPAWAQDNQGKGIPQRSEKNTTTQSYASVGAQGDLKSIDNHSSGKGTSASKGGGSTTATASATAGGSSKTPGAARSSLNRESASRAARSSSNNANASLQDGSSSDLAFERLLNRRAEVRSGSPPGPPLNLLTVAENDNGLLQTPTASPPQVKAATAPSGLPGKRPEFFPDDLAGHPLALFLEGGYEPKDILVAVSAETSSTALEAFAFDSGLVVQEVLQPSLLPFALARLELSDGLQVHDVVGEVEASPIVLAATPNFHYRVLGETSARSIQFAPQRMNIAQAHRIATGKSIKMAVIDTGIDADHRELEGSILDQFDTTGVAKDGAIRHGTAVAGVIAAKSSMTGIAPDVDILSARAFAPSKHDDVFIGTTYDIVKSMDWAYQNGARLFNLSFAGPRDPVLISALERLSEKNAIMIGAAGNSGPGKPPAYPAAHPGVIAVTATDSADNLYEYANRGPYIAVAAPGVDILTTMPGDNYGILTGTSIATAHVSGVVALLLERDSDLGPKAVASLLEQASADLGAHGVDSEFGAGLVDAYKALRTQEDITDFMTTSFTTGVKRPDEHSGRILRPRKIRY